MPAVVKVTGLNELRRALAGVSKEASKEFAAAGKTAGKIVVAQAQRNAGAGEHQGGGTVTPVSKSIRATGAGARVTIVAGGPKTPHAPGMEFGGYIPRRGHKGLGRTGKKFARLLGGRGRLTHLRRQPYLIPAITSKLGEVVSTYENALENLLNKFGRA